MSKDLKWDIIFTVPGNPKALKRHRTVRQGKFTRQYDPSEGDKADFLVKSLEHKPDVPYDEPLIASFEFNFSRPKGHYRTGKLSHLLKENAPEYHIGTPDADNLAKFICDSFNGVFWKDDARISTMLISKRYLDTPGIRIRITRESNRHEK